MSDDNEETDDVKENGKEFPVDFPEETDDTSENGKESSVDFPASPHPAHSRDLLDRRDSERSMNSDSREGATVFMTNQRQENHTTRTYVSEQNLIRSNSWVEANVHMQNSLSEGDNAITSKPICQKIKKCYKSKAGTSVILVAVIVAILLPELYTLANLPDIFLYPYDIIMIINGIGLIVDIVLTSIFLKKYVFRLYFWADVLGTISILLDIRAIFSPESGIRWLSEVLPGLVILRSTRMARIGKLLRVQRAIRSIRLVRIMRLLKIEKFSDALTQAATLAILLIVCVQPMLTFSTWENTDKDTYMLISLARGNAPETKEIVMTWFNDYPGKWYTMPVMVKNFNESWTNPAHAYHTASEEDPRRYSINQFNNVDIWRQGENTEVVMDRTWMNQIEAAMQLAVMVVVLASLSGLSAYIYRRVNKDILLPIGSVFHMIDQVIPGVFSEDPTPDGHASDRINELALLVSKLSRIASMANATEDTIRQDISSSDAMDDSTKAFIMKNYYDQSDEQVEGRRESMIVPARPTLHGRSPSILNFEKQANESELSTEMIDHVKNLKTLNFCCYDYDTSDLMLFARLILQTEGLLEEFNVPDIVANQFIERVRQGYEDVPYHSFYHAVDVMQTLHYFFLTINAGIHTDRLHIFCGLLAALGHDIGHGGVNNSFLVRSRDKLAMVYNDISVLENMHAATLFTIMNEPQYNILCGMPPKVWCKARKVIVQAILSTDMSHHFKLINETELFFELNEKNLAELQSSVPSKDDETKSASQSKKLVQESPFKAPQCQLKLVPLLLHAADISNPAKPFEIYSKHAEKVMEEFFQQGEKEAACGLEVSPMFDRRTSSLAKAQVGFIEFAVGPLYAALLKIFPKLRKCTENLVKNREKYAQMDMDNITEEEERESRIKKNKERHHTFIRKFKRSDTHAMNLFASSKLAQITRSLKPGKSINRRPPIEKRRSVSLDPQTTSRSSLFGNAKKSRTLKVHNSAVHPAP